MSRLLCEIGWGSIGAALGGGVSGLQWVVDAYTLTFAALILTAGALGDRRGAKRVLLGGFTLFTLASVTCGLAPTIGMLIAARAVQGIGAAALGACSLALPRVLGVPAYQVLFVAYWFWGNLLNPRNGIPTVSTTLFTPVGGYIASGLFHVAVSPAGTVSPPQGVTSLLVLVGMAIAVLGLLCAGLHTARTAL